MTDPRDEAIEEAVPDNVLERVRKLVDTAADYDDPKSTAYNPKAAQSYREAADALMLKWAIDEAMLRNDSPVKQRVKPKKITITAYGPGNPIGGLICLLVKYTADFCRCKSVFIGLPPKGTTAKWEVRAKIYGMEPDIQYFQILYTQLSLHLANSLAPKPDKLLSDGENIHRLHVEYGLNWLDIARLYGWDGDQSTASLSGWRIKAKYKAYITEHGLPYVQTGNRIVWMKNFANAYVARVMRRFEELAARRPAETALVLRGSEADVAAFFKEENPDVPMVSVDGGSPVYHAGAYAAGDEAGRRADLGPHMAAGGSAARPIGG